MALQPSPTPSRPTRNVGQVPQDALRVYLITDRSLFPEDQFLPAVEAALKGGVRDLQLREKDLTPGRLFSLAMELRKLTARHQARLYINDRVDVALMVGADGVHLPEHGLPPGEVKTRYPHLLVGVSTHSLETARQAEQGGADFITFSPIFDTPSKQAFGPPQGLDALEEVTRTVRRPVLALGGIGMNHLPEVRKRGAHGVALIRGIWARSDITQTASLYMKAFKGEIT